MALRFAQVAFVQLDLGEGNVLGCLRLAVAHFLGQIEQARMDVSVLGHSAREVAQRAYGLVELVLLGVEVGQAHIGGERLVLLAEGKVNLGEAVEGEEIAGVLFRALRRRPGPGATGAA